MKRTMELPEGVVLYYVAFRESKRFKVALATLILEKKIFVSDTYKPTDFSAWWDMNIYAKPEDVSEIVETLKPFEIEYVGPTFFCWDTIRGVYDTPEDELNNNSCEEYKKHEEKKCNCPH